MTLDNEQQRSLILELLTKSQFPGSALDMVYDLKKAVENAPIESQTKEEAV